MYIATSAQRNQHHTAFKEMMQKGNLSPELAEDIVEAGSQIKMPKAHACDWKAIQATFRKKGALDDEQIDEIEEFTVAAGVKQKALAAKVKDETATAADLRQLNAVELYLQRLKKPTEKYKEIASRSAVAALAGASFGPIATVAAYLTWNPAPKKDVEELAGLLDHLGAGDSPLLTQGNKVTPVHQEKLWQTMIQMLEEATASAKAGHPVEIDVQYFEMTSSSYVGKLAEAAQAGCPVRINIDPSRPTPGGLSDATSIDDGPRKMRALLQMSALKDCNVAISVFPVAKELGHLDELMHRKLLRVGDKVLLGGMNANEGSGENFDTGYLLEGPAAARLVEGFRADVTMSARATPEDIYGGSKIADFEEGTVCLTPHGLATTFDALSGPSPAGTRIPAKPGFEELQAGAEKLGLKLDDLIKMPEAELQGHLKHGFRQPVELTDSGKKLLFKLMQRTFAAVGDPKNQAALADITLPDASPKGDVPVALGGVSEEREALLLHAISTAEKFVFAPTFVITRAVARAMVARRDELAAQGKQLDVRVVADAGLYGFGGTPNEEGFLALEDAGIPVRWSLLTRAEGDHDRKIHAKQILTDKMELVGSTNLSNKGVRDNWELGGLVYFEDDKPNSVAARQDGKERFLKLWENEAIALDTKAVSARLVDEAGIKPENREVEIEKGRNKVIRNFLSIIQNYEVQSGKFIEEKLADPKILERANQLQATGMAFGYARLMAVEEVMGSQAFHAALDALPAKERLRQFANGGG